MSVEFTEGKRDRIEDIYQAKIALQTKFLTGPIDPIFIHYSVVIRALDELIAIRKMEGNIDGKNNS